MAYIKLIGKRDADPVEDANEKLLSDADYTRVATWAAVQYFPNGVLVPGSAEVPAVLDEQGNVVTPAVPAVPDSYRQPTGDEVFHALTEGVYLDIKNKVDAWYYAQIKAQVEPLVEAQFAPITLTPVS